MAVQSSDNAVPTVLIDNELTKVTEWRFAAGAQTGWHRHEMDYMVVPMLDGKLRIDSGEGQEVIAELSKGVPYFRNIGVEHNVINANDYEYVFIEVEYK